MAPQTQIARITGPLAYLTDDGKASLIPPGPCLIERDGEQQVGIVWGESGQHSTSIPSHEFERAEHAGRLVLLG